MLIERSCCCCWPRLLTRLIDQAALALLFSPSPLSLPALSSPLFAVPLFASRDCHDESRWSTRFADRISNGTVRYPRKSSHTATSSIRSTPTRDPSLSRLTGARGPTCRAALSPREEIRVRVVLPGSRRSRVRENPASCERKKELLVRFTCALDAFIRYFFLSFRSVKSSAKQPEGLGRVREGVLKCAL